MPEPKMETRIRALLRKASGTDNSAEAEAFRTKALELIAQYGLDEVLLRAEDEAPPRFVHRSWRWETEPARWIGERFRVMTAFAQVAQARIVRSREWSQEEGSFVSHVCIVGTQEMVDVLATFLPAADDQMLLDMAEATGQWVLACGSPSPRGHEVRGFKRDWMVGYANGVLSHGDAVRQARRRDTGKSLIPALRAHDDELSSYVGDLFGKIKSIKREPIYTNPDAFDAGHMAGEEAPLPGVAALDEA